MATRTAVKEQKMNKKNLEILNLGENATREDIESAYAALRQKYRDERFLEGEEGNRAAKNLTKLEAAYSELLKELNEKADESGVSFQKVEELIASGNYNDAQRVLDEFNERGGQWHYLQSVVFYRKNWINESKKQLEIAIQLEPDNLKYKETYRKLNEKIAADQNAQNPNAQQGAYQGQTMQSNVDDGQMGGNACANCLSCCYTYLCVNCLCNMCTSGC